MKPMNGVLATLALGIASAWPAAASAAEGDAAAAEALFEQGRQAMERKEYDDACSKFRESQRLDPAVGTLFNLANCEEQRGKLATAWEHYRAVIEQLPPGDSRLETAKERAKNLSARVPKLTINLAADTPEGTVVERDGVKLGKASLGTALPIDPGEHAIVVSAPGKAATTTRVTVSEGESKVVEVAPGGVSEEAGGSTTADTGDGSNQKTLGYVLGGVGVAGLAVGAITGFMAIGKKSTVDSHCDADRFCDAEGADAAESGRTLATVSTIGLVVGALGVGAGAYFILSADSKSETGLRASVLPGASSVSLTHRW